MLTKKGFIRWIQTINHNTVREDLRDKFIQYQTMIFDYLYGSAHEHATAKANYNRLQKLNRLYSKIGNEIQDRKSVGRERV